MTSAGSDDDRPDELTERYRAASAADPARPSDSVRRAVLAYARTVAGDHAPGGTATVLARRPAANYFRWRIAAAASVIVAGFATVLAWHFHAPTPLPAQASTAVAARIQPAAEPIASNQPPEPTDQRGRSALAPNAVTTRSRQRTGASPESPRDIGTAQGAAADLAGNVASPRPAPASAAEATATAKASARSDAIAEVGSSPASAAAAARSSVAPSSPLVIAAESGNLERVDQLLRSGVSTEQTDAQGRTALLVATLRGDIPMVRRLLVAGARADVTDTDGDTPLAAARRQGSPELVRLLERATHP